MTTRVVLSLFLAIVPSAQTTVAQETIWSPSVEEVALGDDLYLLRIHHIPGGWVNALLLYGTEGAILVDHGGDWRSLTATEPLTTAMQEVLTAHGIGAPRWVVNTHWHGDHTGGNPYFGGRSQIVAHANTRKRLTSQQRPDWYPEGIGPQPTIGWPHVVFTDSMTIYVGRDTVTLVHFGRAHTDGDVVVHFHRQRVMHLGDLYHGADDPSFGDDMEGIARTLGAVLERSDDATTMVTGHGGVTTRDELARYNAMLEGTIAFVRREVAAGRQLDAIQRSGVPDPWARIIQDPEVQAAWIEEIHRSIIVRPELVQVSDSLAGKWVGALGAPPNAVALGLSFQRGGEAWSGTFEVPSEGIRDLPLLSVERAGDEVVARLTPQRIFRGRMMGDSLPGRVIMHDRGGLEIEVILHREGSGGWERVQVDLARWEEERMTAPAPGLAEGERGEAWARVDSAALAHLVDAAEASRTSAMVVLHDGELVGSWYDRRGDRRIEAMSATKSVVSLAVGRLLAMDLLESLDVPVHRYFPEWRDGPHSGITVRHLMNHTSGLDSPMPTTPIYQSGDFLAFALEAEQVSEPGTESRYNNNATNLLAGVIGEAAGVRMDRFIGEELFGPMGITDFGWSLDLAENPHGMAGLQIRAADLALLGQLVLQDGVWNGERLLPPGWIAESVRPGSELARSVGLLWWLIWEDGQVAGARADGYLGQYLVIYPNSGIVGVRMIEAYDGYVEARDGFAAFQDLLRELR